MAQHVVLDNKLEISNVAQLEAELSEYINEEHLVFDASSVDRIDTMGAQLLVSFVKTVHELGHDVLFEKPSKVFLDTIITLGLTDEFNLMDATND